jgi:serine/threonine protein kinase
MTEEIEPHILKKYEIVEKLGKGAYGIVWKAVDRKLKQVVALKKVQVSLCRCSMPSIMPLMRSEPSDRSCSCSSLTVNDALSQATRTSFDCSTSSRQKITKISIWSSTSWKRVRYFGSRSARGDSSWHSRGNPQEVHRLSTSEGAKVHAFGRIDSPRPEAEQPPAQL